MKEQILEISEKLRLELITTDEALDLLLGLFVVSVNGVPYNMQDVILYYDKSKFVFNSSITDVLIGMLYERMTVSSRCRFKYER